MEVDRLTGKAAGGKARAKVLSPERRKQIAQYAAKMRHEGTLKLPKAEFEGDLNLNGYIIPSAVLETGERVLSQRGVNIALGRGAPSTKAEEMLPAILAPQNIRPFISSDLMLKATEKKSYLTKGKFRAIAIPAEMLPEICDVWLKARDAGALLASQQKTAIAADLLVRALAQVGIIALVDEATGYQNVRPKDALEAYLAKIIRKELAAWVKKFPDEFYENIYKLKGWPWHGMSKNRYSAVAGYTNNLVYARMAHGLKEELAQKSPPNENGHRPNKLHQWLNEEVGDPMLAQHLHSIIVLQRLAIANGYGYNKFLKMVDKVMPLKGATLELPLDDPNDPLGI